MENPDEIADKLYGENTFTNSVNDVTTAVKNKSCERKQHTTSQTSNLESVSSSYSTFSENAEGSHYHSSRQSKNGEDHIRRAHPSSLLSELSSRNSSLMKNHSSVDADNDTQLKNVEELPGRAGDHLGCDVEKSSHSSDEYGNSKISVDNQKETVARSQEKEVETNNDGGNLPEEPSKSPEQCLEEEKVGNVPATLNVKDTSLQSDHANDSDESDVVEHDVKVCDICGDAGREDLLAICCRCIDGAEHTYCMKEMIDQVPEGDWLCEECKLHKESENTNREMYGAEAGARKDQSSGQVDTEPASTFNKQDTKGPAVEDPRTSRDYSVVKGSGKRRAEESESSSAVKKQALEIITGSPRTSSSRRLHALSDSSTKDVDRGKVKSIHQSSSDTLFGNESPEAARSPAARPRLQSLRGAFFKSNSFNFPNARSKTKLVDEIVLQRQKSTKERASHDTTVAREMGKSMSFRSTNLGRSGASGSKVKMLSPKSSHVQDLKSLKNKKERSFERNNSVKLPTVGNLNTSSSSTPKADKLLVSRGETTPVSSACNSEVKTVQGDSKINAGLKSISRSANIGAEVPVFAGPVNKQLPSSPPGVGTASHGGMVNSIEQKSLALKDDISSKPAVSKESTNLADGIKETTTTSHVGPGLNPGTSGVSCQNYKHTGHSAQIPTADKPGSSGPNASAMRSSEGVKNRDNKLKDAIEAALLKKPGIYRKNRVPEQSDESSVSSMNNEVAVVDRIPYSRNAGNLTSAEALTDWQGQNSRSSNANHCKQSNGKHSTTEPPIHAAALSSLLKIPAIPDHEYIWQGSFEINKSGKTAEFWDGLQAHLSTCASPRVFEAVNNLPHKILLNGVSRISAWPAQFENSGAKEDNIALYFFAKDVESYEKSYQVLLDDMIRSDLALIGSIDGVELLIFPSNQLPEKSHRWNMLFFLWGVFRGNKKNSLHQVPDYPERNCIPQVASSTSPDKTSLAEDTCSIGSIDKERHDDSESKGGNLKLQTSLQEKAIDCISGPPNNVNVFPSSKETLSFKPATDVSVPNKNDNQDVVNIRRTLKVDQGPLVPEAPPVDLNHIQIEPRKRTFLDLSEDVGFTTTNQININQTVEENLIKKQKSDFYDHNSCSTNVFKQCEVEETLAGNNNGERYFFPVDPTRNVKGSGSSERLISLLGSSFSQKGKTPNLELALGADLNENISCLVEETDKRMMMKKEDDDDVSSSLSLSLSFSSTDKDEEERGKGNRHPAPKMVLFRDIVDK